MLISEEVVCLDLFHLAVRQRTKQQESRSAEGLVSMFAKENIITLVEVSVNKQ